LKNKYAEGRPCCYGYLGVQEIRNPFPFQLKEKLLTFLFSEKIVSFVSLTSVCDRKFFPSSLKDAKVQARLSSAKRLLLHHNNSCDALSRNARANAFQASAHVLDDRLLQRTCRGGAHSA